jgi:hypothetical protein
MKAVVIIGPGGSGKTTSAVYTCMLDKTICFMSGNRIFVQGTKVVSGVSGVRLRAGSLKLELGLRGPSVPSHLGFYDTKVSLTPEEIGLSNNPKYPIKLGKIIIAKKFEKAITVQKLNTSNEDQMNEAFLNLYSSTSEFSENFPNFLLGPKIPYPDLFTNRLRTARISFIKGLLRSVDVVKVEGKLEEISSYITYEIRR